MENLHARALVEAFIKAAVEKLGKSVEVFIVLEYGPAEQRKIGCGSTISDPNEMVDLVGRAVGESAARMLEFQRPIGPMQ